MRVVVNVEVSVKRAQELAKVYCRLKCSLAEAALFIGCAAAGLRLKDGDFDGVEDLVTFVETECGSLKTPMTFAVRDQIEQIRTELYGTRMGRTNRSYRETGIRLKSPKAWSTS